jgi:hypothetical protein
VLDDLGALGRGQQEWRGSGDAAGAGDYAYSGVIVAAGEGQIYSPEDFCGTFVVCADDDAVGVEKVGDGGSFAEKLRVRDDVEEVAGCSIALHGACDPLVRVNGNGAFFYDDLIVGDGTGDLAGDSFNVGEIGIARIALGRSDGDKDGFAFAGGLGEIGHEADFGVPVLIQEFRERILVDEGVAGPKSGYLALVIVDADDVVTHFGETNSGNKTDIS